MALNLPPIFGWYSAWNFRHASSPLCFSEEPQRLALQPHLLAENRERDLAVGRHVDGDAHAVLQAQQSSDAAEGESPLDEVLVAS
eukprot:2608547-Heterocapsa_arctica.AAC.1